MLHDNGGALMKGHQTDMALTELAMYKEYGLKPNFSELSRKTELDRHTLRKYWREGGKIDKKRGREGSRFLPSPSYIFLIVCPSLPKVRASSLKFDTMSIVLNIVKAPIRLSSIIAP